jgi:tRNA-2-methylthio-N6-dimethylallyladenosine synthase
MDREHIQQRAGHVDVVFGTHNLGRAPALLRQAVTSGPVMEILDEPLPEGDPDTVGSSAAALTAVRDLPYAAWVTIQIGCDNSCAFCIVPSVRGAEVSRPFADLVGEVEVLADRGVSEVTLLGQNVNSYGRDLTKRRPLFADLLRAVGAVEGIRRVRFTSPHPKDLRPETIAAMAETPAVCNHLHLPLQAGANATLAAMRRGYTAQRYLERLAAARAAIADLAVTTDLIVGFPGESEEDFEATLEVAAVAEYDSAYTFIFSPRPGTRAAEMENRFVPEDVVADRFERLRVVVERSALAKHRARIGRVEEVLVEGPSKRDASLTTGRTGQNKLVHFAPVGDQRVPVGSFAMVKVTGAAPHHLTGELVEVIGRPRHRTRIPVAAG